MDTFNIILKKALELRAYELKVSNIEVSTDLSPDVPETMADPHQLQQVFLNLIVNAEHRAPGAGSRSLDREVVSHKRRIGLRPFRF